MKHHVHLVSMTECDTVNEKKTYGEKASKWEKAKEIQKHPGFMNSVKEMIAFYHVKTT